MKILVIQQKMIGDVLVSTILCDNLRKAYPNAQIDYMVYESTLPVLEGNTSVDNFILFKKKHRNSKFQFAKLILEIRKTKYDIIIDAYSKIESWTTVFFSGAKRKISYKKSWQKFLYTDNVPIQKEPKTSVGLTIERRLSLLSPLGLDIDFSVVPKLQVTVKEKEFAKNLFLEHGLDMSKKTVMMSIIGSAENKTYPLEYMATLVDFIADNAAVNILFNYMPNQLKLAKTVYNQCSEKTQKKIYFNLLGKNLREFIAIMDACDFIIGNDSGSINMAKALDKPSFIVFSPWIEKKMWATFEDGILHDSVHLQDYKPMLFEGKTEKELKENAIAMYPALKPFLFKEKLLRFLKFHSEEKSNKVVSKFFDTLYNTKKRQPLSALIITYNEESNIDALIQNISFADEIIVVDSYSTDTTIAVLKKHKHVKIIQHAFKNFSEQRNFALQQVKNDWVLFLDADELLSKELIKEVKFVLESNQKHVAFEMYRQFYFQQKPLHFSGWQTDKVVRLFNKNYAFYEPQKLVHETLNIKGSAKILKNKLIHFSYTNYKAYKAKMDSYAKLRAQELFTKKLKPNFYHFHLKPLYRFLNHFVFRFGFLDGKKGYTICKLSAYGVKQRYIELQKLYKIK